MVRRVARKRYLVGIPVPSLDRRGQPLEEHEVSEWTRRVLDELTACFGGATPIPAPGTNVVQGLADGMVEAFAGRMADALQQDAVFVLAFHRTRFSSKASSSLRRRAAHE